MLNKRNIVVLSGLVIVVAIAIGAYMMNKNTSNQTAKGISVTASYYPLYDFARNIGGDKVTVTNITPAGAEPHDYEPTPQQLVGALKSDVFIYNGGTMEPWVNKFLTDYPHTAVKASNGIMLNSGQAEDGGAAPAGSSDPHFWLDPVLAERIVDSIKDGLKRADPANAAYYEQRATAYKAKLAALDRDYASGLANCQTRTIVTAHQAFSYIGKRYNLNIVAIAGLTPDEEPSAERMADLANKVRENNIKYIFFETLTSPKLAQTIANETGAQTAVFDPIEGLSDADQKQGKDYLSVQRENLANLRTALACQ